MRSQSEFDLCRFDYGGELSTELLGDAEVDSDRSLQQQQHKEPDHHGARLHSAEHQYVAWAEHDRVPCKPELYHADSQ